MKENSVICSHCGQLCPDEEMIWVEDDPICEYCSELETFVCIRCGGRFLNHSNYGDENTPLCEHCYCEGEYHACDRCGGIIAESCTYYLDDANEPLCDDCYQYRKDQCSIHDYNFKPTPIFYGNGGRYMGVELEIDKGGHSDWNAHILLDAVNGTEERIYIKSDSSLNDGFEIVTHPMDMNYHQQKMPWEELCRNAVKLGYLSHQTNTCGLHIHVNRDSLGMTRTNQEVTISKILLMMEKFWPEMVRFSRRTVSQLERWAQRYGFEKKGQEILDKAKKGSIGRYASLNLESKATIEFRIFRGTLKTSSVLAALELVDALCDYAINYAEEVIQDLSWIDFVSDIAFSRPGLEQYLKERRLYINEPVCDSEEEL